MAARLIGSLSGERHWWASVSLARLRHQCSREGIYLALLVFPWQLGGAPLLVACPPVLSPWADGWDRVKSSWEGSTPVIEMSSPGRQQLCNASSLLSRPHAMELMWYLCFFSPAHSCLSDKSLFFPVSHYWKRNPSSISAVLPLEMLEKEQCTGVSKQTLNSQHFSPYKAAASEIKWQKTHKYNVSVLCQEKFAFMETLYCMDKK